MMTDASGREVKMVGRVVTHDMKYSTYEVWLPNGMTISVVDSALNPYMGPVPLMNNAGSVRSRAYSSTTAPGSPATMARTASSSSFNFNLNKWNKGDGNKAIEEDASNNEYNENIYEGDPWERLAAFVNKKENTRGIKINKRNTRTKRSVESAAHKAQRKKGGAKRTKRSARRTQRSIRGRH